MVLKSFLFLYAIKYFVVSIKSANYLVVLNLTIEPEIVVNLFEIQFAVVH